MSEMPTVDARIAAVLREVESEGNAFYAWTEYGVAEPEEIAPRIREKLGQAGVVLVDMGAEVAGKDLDDAYRVLRLLEAPEWLYGWIERLVAAAAPDERHVVEFTDTGFWEHFGYISRELLRLVKPGRLVAVHVANLPAYENRDGASGRKDFRGDTIRHFESIGFVYHSEICIDKNPQAQAIRTHSKGLLFVQLRRDAAWMWQAWADYICVFRAPGQNAVPVDSSDLSEDDWVEWARPVWTGLRETDVLQARDAREHDDERHLAPLQLPVIERCIRLWTNRGDVVLSPFAGIGSEGVVALKWERRFVGVELKPAYWRVAAEHLRATHGEMTLGLDRTSAEPAIATA